MIKYLFATIIGILLVAGLGFTPTTFAHELKQNNGTSLVLHILPDDDPLVGEPTDLDLSFGSSKNGFNIANCDCSLDINQSGKLIKHIVLNPSAPGATQTASTTFIFPKAGAYNVIVTGIARNHEFSNFKLEYPVTVRSGTGNAAEDRSGAMQEVALISAASFTIFFVLVLNVVRQSSRYNKN